MYNKHHLLFERRSYKTPLEKRVRKMGAFILEAPIANHRLLHFSLDAPEKPSHGTLEDLEILGRRGLEMAMRYLDDPIIEHFNNQQEILFMDTETALQMLEARERWVA